MKSCPIFKSSYVVLLLSLFSTSFVQAAKNCLGCTPEELEAIQTVVAPVVQVGAEMLQGVVVQNTHGYLKTIQEQYPAAFNTLVFIVNNQKVQDTAFNAATPILKQFGIMNSEGKIDPIVAALVAGLTKYTPPTRGVKGSSAILLELDEAIEEGGVLRSNVKNKKTKEDEV